LAGIKSEKDMGIDLNTSDETKGVDEDGNRYWRKIGLDSGEVNS